MLYFFRLVNRTSVNEKVKEKKFYWDCSCVAEHFEKHPELTIAKPWWKEIESHEVETVDGLPNPLLALASDTTTEKTENPLLRKAAVDGYCKVDCQTQFYSLLGFMFIAGLIGSSTRLPNTILSLRTIDKRDKVRNKTIYGSFKSKEKRFKRVDL